MGIQDNTEPQTAIKWLLSVSIKHLAREVFPGSTADVMTSGLTGFA